MNRPGLGFYENLFLDALDKHEFGKALSRGTILKDMGYDGTNKDSIAIYNDTVASLCAKEIVETARGSGGGAKYSGKYFENEKVVYEPISEYLSKTFRAKLDPAISDRHFLFEETHSNKKQIQNEGKWINPDFLLIWHEKYKYSTPRQLIKTASFEIKNDYRQYVTGVFEAVSHARFVNKSYLVICDFCDGDYKNIEQRVLLECRRLNIGLISYYHPTLTESFQIVFEPETHFPDPADSDAFLSAHLSLKKLGEIQHWLS